MSAHGTVFWNECMTHDADRAKAFYAGLMGWELVDGPMPGGGGRYIVARMGERPIAGMMPMEGKEFAQAPSMWMTYLAVDDIDAAVAKVAGLGGTVVRPPFTVEGVARIALLKDPAGAVIGLAEPLPGFTSS